MNPNSNSNSNSADDKHNGVAPPPAMPRPQRMAASAPPPTAEPFGGSLFRSVSMAVPAQSPTLGGFGAGGPTLRGMPSHAKSMPGPLQAASPTMKAPLPFKIKPVAKNSVSRVAAPVQSSTPSTPYEWKVDAMPPSIPMYHPVDLRTSLVLKDGATTLEAVSITTSRLSKFMQRHSIHAQYSSKDNNNDNPFEDDLVRVTCVTPNMNHFCVQLWTLPEQPSTLIVEMQRRQGCCMEHQRIRRGLYQLLQTGEEETASSVNAPAPTKDTLLNKVCDNAVKTSSALPGRLPPPLPRSFAFAKKIPPIPKGMNFGAMKPGLNDVEKDQTIAMDMCRNLLTANNRRDQHELGLESLVSICNPQKVSASLAERACRAVICPENGDCAIQNAVFMYCRDNQRPGESKDAGETKEDIDADDMGWYGGYAEGRHYRTMHMLALRILSQSLNVVASSSVALDSTVLSDIATCCTYNLQIAKHRPLEAELSARCLRMLLERYHDPSAAVAPLTPPPSSCVMEAHSHGQLHHSGLHHECGLLMQVQEQLLNA
eukprot:CAMPEP_0119545216 /NCGR_PEP_ID=MMETSP1352-20130426/8_1 /TAXON_ID=265584 /ORGANISM="Stauroneis constricta, Strain CCMP1120" /LENGTH=540 /DNA_ID=CAMNT_0007589737 /DNA_START=268 /DNA_END=1890 /DNA_ORIENTATION=+